MNYFSSLLELDGLCESLYSQLSNIEDNDEFNEEKIKIEKALQKLSIAEIIQGQNIICVTGLQGVGKTSLMKNFYGFDSKSMNISEGRGETIPILIAERENLKEPEFYVWELQEDEKKRIQKIKNPVKAEDFSKMTNDSGKNILYLEMDVPFKFINNEGCAFLLLPGFEKRHSRWQEMIDFCVKTSDVALFVTDYSSFVSKENEQLLERIKKQFSEHSMIVALTKSDLSEEQNEQEKSQVQKEFNLKDDQVILTGTFSDEAKNEKWRNELENAINKYNSDGNAEAVFEMMGDIKNEIKDSISEIEGKIDQKKIEQKLEKFGADDEIEILSKKISKIKKAWLKNLKKRLDEAESKSVKIYEDKKVDETGDEKLLEDLKKKAKRLFNHITGDGIKNFVERERLIESCLQNNNLPYSVEAIALSFFDDADSGNEISKYLLGDSANDEKKEEFMGNLSILLQDKKQDKKAVDKNGKPLQFKGDAQTTYEMLAELAVLNYGKILSKNIINDYPTIKQEIKVSEPANLFKNMDDSKKLGLGLFAMAGIDFLPDQNFNALSSLAASLGISTGAMVGIFAGVMAGAGIITLTRDINEREIRKLKEDEEVIHKYYSDVYKATVNDFDDAMENLKEKVSENFLAYEKVDEHHFALINARSIIADIKDRINEMYSAARLESRLLKPTKSLENKIAGYIEN